MKGEVSHHSGKGNGKTRDRVGKTHSAGKAVSQELVDGPLLPLGSCSRVRANDKQKGKCEENTEAVHVDEGQKETKRKWKFLIDFHHVFNILKQYFCI